MPTRTQVPGRGLSPLVWSEDVDLLHELQEVLEAHGVRAAVLEDAATGPSRPRASRRTRPCVAVGETDRSYARWLAWRMGMDAGDGDDEAVRVPESV